MEVKSFYLLRHGEYLNPLNIFPGRLSISLSSEGKKQAERIARELSGALIRKIYSSAVLRCAETSEILAETLKVPVEYDKRLLEQLSPIQGLPISEYLKDRNVRFSSTEALGGETMMDMQVRMLDFFYEKMKEEEGSIVICSHGDPLYFLYLGLAGKDLPHDVGGIVSREYQPKGSFRKVDIEGDRFVIGEIQSV